MDVQSPAMKQNNLVMYCMQCMLLILVGISRQMSVIAQKLVVYPCTDFDAIRWVRDATFCNQYYICHFGQPLAMPSCPAGQVWSNTALNCVPQDSRWDDCSGRSRPLKTEKRTTQNSRLSTVTRRPLQTNPPISPRTTPDVVITVNNLPPEIKAAKSKKTPVLRNDSKKLDVKAGVSLGYPHYIVDIGGRDGIGKRISDILKSDDSDTDRVSTIRSTERNVKNSEGNQLVNTFFHEKDARVHSLRRESQQQSDVDFGKKPHLNNLVYTVSQITVHADSVSEFNKKFRCISLSGRCNKLQLLLAVMIHLALYTFSSLLLLC